MLLLLFDNVIMPLYVRKGSVASVPQVVAMKKDAAGFIKRIFHSEDDIWVDRCSSIIKE